MNESQERVVYKVRFRLKNYIITPRGHVAIEVNNA